MLTAKLQYELATLPVEAQKPARSAATAEDMKTGANWMGPAGEEVGVTGSPGAAVEP